MDSRSRMARVIMNPTTPSQIVLKRSKPKAIPLNIPIAGIAKAQVSPSVVKTILVPAGMAISSSDSSPVWFAFSL